MLPDPGRHHFVASEIAMSSELKRGLCGWTVFFLLCISIGELYVRTSTPAALAIQFVRHDPVVQESVGGIQEARLGWIGNIHYAGNNGWASFNLHVVGARTNGTVDITMQRQLGKWSVADAELVTDSGQVVKIAGQPDELSAANPD
jgi:hypothetical protein